MVDEPTKAAAPATDADQQAANQQPAEQPAETPAAEASGATLSMGVEVTPPEVIQGAPDAEPTAPNAADQEQPAEQPAETPADETESTPDADVSSPPLTRRDMSLLSLTDLVREVGPAVGKLQTWLAGIDVGKLKALVPAVDALFNVPGDVGSVAWIEAEATACLQLLRVWSAIQPGNPDHALIDRLDHLIRVGGPALEAVADLVKQLLTQHAGAAASQLITMQHLGDVMHAGHEPPLRAASLDISTLFSIVQAVVALIKTLQGLKGSPAPAPSPAS